MCFSHRCQLRGSRLGGGGGGGRIAGRQAVGKQRWWLGHQRDPAGHPGRAQALPPLATHTHSPPPRVPPLSPARAHKHHRHLVLQAVGLAAGGRQGDGAAHSIVQVDLRSKKGGGGRWRKSGGIMRLPAMQRTLRGRRRVQGPARPPAAMPRRVHQLHELHHVNSSRRKREGPYCPTPSHHRTTALHPTTPHPPAPRSSWTRWGCWSPQSQACTRWRRCTQGAKGHRGVSAVHEAERCT